MKGCWILDTLETKVLWDEAWNVSCGNAFSSISSSVGEGGGEEEMTFRAAGVVVDRSHRACLSFSGSCEWPD